MEFGVGIFFTDYSISPAELAMALEERGIDVLWAPEHSHIPTSRRTPAPGGGELAKRYYDVMNPFVTLAAAAAATKHLKVGTGVCLVIQRDTIQTAKQVASLDQISGGALSVRHRRRVEPGGDGRPRHRVRDPLQADAREAMTEIWTKQKAEYHGDIVDFPPMMTWPKPLQKPRPPVLVGGAFPWAARRAIRYGDGWFPIAGARYGDPLIFRQKRTAEAMRRRCHKKPEPTPLPGAATLPSAAAGASTTGWGTCAPDRLTQARCSGYVQSVVSGCV
jgi:alkanesulfonate monooxygenase SsuD/methylene tetrahydromethanopterin reductase-like flavin-dependent oxidoreductase (luciferase family)